MPEIIHSINNYCNVIVLAGDSTISVNRQDTNSHYQIIRPLAGFVLHGQLCLDYSYTNRTLFNVLCISFSQVFSVSIVMTIGCCVSATVLTLCIYFVSG